MAFRATPAQMPGGVPPKGAEENGAVAAALEATFANWMFCFVFDELRRLRHEVGASISTPRMRFCTKNAMVDSLGEILTEKKAALGSHPSSGPNKDRNVSMSILGSALEINATNVGSTSDPSDPTKVV